MILASCRKGFSSNHRFDDLALRHYPKGYGGTHWPMTEGALADVADGSRVIVFVHGFRNPIDRVGESYDALVAEMSRRKMIGRDYDLCIGFLWPGFRTAAGFFPAVPWANRSAVYLRHLLAVLLSRAEEVDVQTHSLGGRVALQALAFAAHDGISVRNLMLTAPAVDDEALEPSKEFHGALDACGQCVVYHSRQDKTLAVGYRVGGLDAALGCRGPEHPAAISAHCRNVRVADCTAVVSSHGGYRRAPAVYEHWQALLSTGGVPTFTKL